MALVYLFQVALHDASSGFHDIKPLPLFSPFPIWLVIFVVIGSLLLALLYYYLKKRKLNKQENLSPLTAEQEALAALEELERKAKKREITLRELSTSLSLLYRRFLERSFSFHATDQTIKEIMETFPSLLKKKLLHLPPNTRDEITTKSEQLLRLLGYYAFASNTEALIAVDDLQITKSFEEIRYLITDLAFQLKKEDERLKSVTEARSIGN